MKKSFLFLFLLFSVPYLIVSAEAAEGRSPSLSPAIDILQNQTELLKGNIAGSKIDFSKKDFESIFGKKGFQSITLVSLPKSNVGLLKVNGKDVVAGQAIPKDELNSLCFLPVGNEAGLAEFEFCSSGEANSFTCKLIFGSEEVYQAESTDMSLNTYRNIPVFGTIFPEKTEQIKIEVVETVENGILSLDQKNGTFCYSPATDFTGHDQFIYRIKDAFGNYSENLRATIRTEHAKNNLYFYDCAKNPSHNAAIWVCEQGIMEYELDENSLPVFSPEQTVNTKEFYSYAAHCFSLVGEKKRIDNSVFHDLEVPYDQTQETLTLAGASDILLDLATLQDRKSVV